MADDEIVERIVNLLRDKFKPLRPIPLFTASFLDGAEAYRLAFIDGVRERAAVRRQAKRVRAKVFAALGLADNK